MDKYVCDICGYVYDPAEGDPDNGVAPGTAWESVPELGMSSLRRRQGALLQAVRQRKKTPVPCRYRRFFAEKQAYCS